MTVKKKLGFRLTPNQEDWTVPLLTCPGSSCSQPRSSTLISQFQKESSCIWYYTGWRTWNGSSKGFKGQWKNSEAFQREIKICHSSPLVLQCDTITWKSQQSSYKILREKGTWGRPPLLFAPSCKEEEKTAWFALRGHNCFSNRDKLSLSPE